MPYIDANRYKDFRLDPLPNETFNEFHNRILPGLVALEPYVATEYHERTVKDAWVHFVLRNSTEVTMTVKRDVNTYFGLWYFEGDFSDWYVDEISSARTISLGTEIASLEMANADSGEVFKIAKSQEDEQLVFGWANIAIDANGHYPIDWDGDVTDPSDLEKAAYNFVLKYRATGENHQGEIKGDLVESIMFTKEKQAALGIPSGTVPEGWWVGFHVPDKEVFAKIKSGEYQMFSVEGTAIRDPLQAQGGES